MTLLPLLSALLINAAAAAPIALPAPPAGEGAHAPHLVAGPDGTMLLTWSEPGAVKMSWLKGRRWSPVRTVAQGDDLFINWADFGGAVPLAGGRVLAHWRQKEGEGTYAYGVRLAVSDYVGRKWQPLGAPHKDGTESEHGFVSVAPDERGGAWVYWLDGRNTVAKPKGPMTLRRAYVDPSAAVGPSEEVDGSVCDCCPTSAAGGAVVYRDRTSMDVRDIRVAADGATHPVAVDGWAVQGCPVNGPALAAGPGGGLVAAWYTQGGERVRVLAARSDDRGKTWSKPVEVAGPSALGRVDVAVDKQGDAYVSWLDGGSAEKGRDATIKVRRLTRGGGLGEVVDVAATMAARASGMPQMALRRRELIFAWTEVGETTSIKLALLPTQGVPRGEDPYRLPPGLAGRVVVAQVWSTTCRPCLDELPAMADLHRQLTPHGGAVLAINVDPPGQADDVRATTNRMRLPFPTVHDPKGDTGVTARVLPTTVVFDRSGRPVARFERLVMAEDPALLDAIARAGIRLPGATAPEGDAGPARPLHKSPAKGGTHAHPKPPGPPR